MAISFIGSTPAAANDNASAAVTSNTFKNSAGSSPTAAIGDAIIVGIARGSAGAATPSAPTNGVPLGSFSALGSVAFGNDSDDINLHLFAAEVTSTPANFSTTLFTVGASGSASNGQIYVSHILRGADFANLIALTGGASRTDAVGINSALANAPSATPTVAGSWIAVFGAGGYNTAFSADYSLPGDLSATTNHWRAGRAESLTQKAILGAGLKTDWAAGAFDPGAFTGPSTNNRQSWAASTLVIPPTTSSTQALTPSLFTNTNTHYGPTITAGAVTLTPPLVTNTETFHAATVAQVTSLTAGLFTNTQAFHDPAFAVGAVTLAPSLATNTSTFPAHTLSATYALTPSLVSNAQTFFGPTVAVGAVDLTPGLVSNAQTFYGPTIGVGAVGLTPALFTNTQTHYAPTVEVVGGEQSLTPDLFSNAQSFFGPTVAPGAVTLAPTLATNTQTFHAPTLAAIYGILVPLVENAQAFYSPTVATGQTLTPALFVNDLQFCLAAEIGRVSRRQLGRYPSPGGRYANMTRRR